MNYISRIQKRKKRQFLILSASSIHSGLECLYLEATDNNWQIFHNQNIPYPQTIINLIQKLIQNGKNSFHCEDLAQLENRMTIFLVENAHASLSHIPKIKRRLDLIILKKFSLWKGIVNHKKKPHYWNIPLGDAQILAQSLKTPVLTDFIRQDILDNGTGNLNTLYGDLTIGKKIGAIAIFINIGLTAHVTAIDCQQSKIIIDSDTGPGTCLIDLAAQEAGCTNGFDRDGSTASSGNVNTEALEILIADEWFKQPSPKQADSNLFTKLFKHEILHDMSPVDKLSTVTAFTALTISNFYKREYSHTKKPETIWVSGGGTYNSALIHFLNAYFSPIPVKKIEELGIPDNNRTTLSLGLTVQAYLNQQQIAIPGGNVSTIEHFGKWVLP